MAGLNGNMKWVITILTFAIVVGGTIVGVTNAISGKADDAEVKTLCTEVSVIKNEQENQKEDIQEIKECVKEIRDMLLEERRGGK